MRNDRRKSPRVVHRSGLAPGKISSAEILVRKEGFEPPRPFGHKILSLARLPVPPLPQLTHYTGFSAFSFRVSKGVSASTMSYL